MYVLLQVIIQTCTKSVNNDLKRKKSVAKEPPPVNTPSPVSVSVSPSLLPSAKMEPTVAINEPHIEKAVYIPPNQPEYVLSDYEHSATPRVSMFDSMYDIEVCDVCVCDVV